MTCYFRHLKEIFDKAEIAVTKDNKKQIDKAIHGLVGVEYKNCSMTWKKIKERLLQDKGRFTSELKKILASS